MEYSGITLTPGFVMSAATDPQFNYVTALLHGDGTNAGTNNTFLDSSPNNFAVTRSGTPTQGTFTPFGTLRSTYFPGSSNLLFPFNAAFNLTGDFTIEFWAFRVSGSGGMPLNCGGGSGIANASYEFNYDGNNINFAASSNNSTYDIGSETGSTGSLGTTPYGTWFHIAVTRSGNVYRGFINGVQGYTQTLALTPYSQTTRGLSIGGNYASTWGTGTPTSTITGYMSNVRIVKGTAVYTSNFTPPTAPLTAITNTSLLACQSSYLKDNSTNNFTITPTGATTATVPSTQVFSPFGTTTQYLPATVGGSGYFNFSNTDYLSLPSNAAFAVGTSDFTAEAWIYPVAMVGYHSILSTRPTSSTGSQTDVWVLGVNNTGFLYVYSGAFQAQSAASLIFNNAWYHVAVTRQSGSMKLFINGVLVITASSNQNYTANIMSVGANNNGSENWPGYISNARLLNGTALYTATFTLPTTPLPSIGNTQLLLSGTNGQIYDNGMMNNWITASTAQVSTSIFKYGTGSVLLNGSTDYLSTPATPNFAFGGSDFTVEAWVYRTGGGVKTQSTVLNQSISGATSNTAFFFGAGSDGMALYVSTSGTSWTNFIETSVATTLSTWSHVVWQRRSNILEIYLNGVLQTVTNGTAAFSGTIFTSTRSVEIGTQNAAGAWFTGNIDELRVTKGYARYTANFTAPTSIFPSTGPIPVPTPNVEYLVVAGGGGGGWSNGGGGGAGGYRTNTGLSVTAGSAITVTIGTGGAGSGSGHGSDGTVSVFGSITSSGGGGGGSAQSQGGPGNTGGSGGGGGNDYPRGTQTAGGTGNSGGYTPAEGKNGGASQGGGGGASTSGSDGSTNGVGGAGTYSSITGSSVARGGGGGGSTESATDPVLGGVGGGGNGQKRNSTAPGNGTVNTGGGGGGGANSTGGTGGSGFVAIRYTNDYLAATSTTGSPSITNTGGYWIYAWTSSGSITF